MPTNQTISRSVLDPPMMHAQTFFRIKSVLAALGSIFLLIQPVEAVEIHPVTAPGKTLQGQALSGDGKVVVGSQGNIPSALPFRWSVAGGYQVLPEPSYGNHGWVGRANHDGNAFIGNFQGGSPGYRWTESGGYTAPITVPTRLSGAVFGISGDGTVVVGDSRGGGRGFYAFRFIAGAYTVFDDVNDDGQVLYREFLDVSADGRYVVGKGQFENNLKIFRHDFDTGARIILGTSDDFWTAAAISADAGVVIGQTSNIAISPFRWDVATSDVVYLGSLDPTRQAIPQDLNGDGSVIVGRSLTASGSTAFVWDAAGGMRSLEIYLQERGVDTTGWAFAEATGISDDGDAILARGTSTGFDNGPILINGLTQPVPATLQSGFSGSGEAFEVTFDTRTGQNYWVEGSDSPASNTWTEETIPSEGTGSPATLSLPVTGYPSAGYYFRVGTGFTPAE